MLKKISRLFLGLVVCAGSACVTPTHVSSADSGSTPQIVIARIQASGELGAKDEYIVLHNNSPIKINITNWCLMNKNMVLFACFESTRSDVIENFYIPPHADVVVASSDRANNSGHDASLYSLIYEVTNQSSGSIINSSDSISVLNQDGEVIDIKEWTTAIPTGKVLARMLVLTTPPIYSSTGTAIDWITENRSAPPADSLERVVQPIEPEPDTNPEVNPPNNPQNVPTGEMRMILSPMITEILANPSGSDAGKEFIELHNPNEHDSISLSSFTLLVDANPAKSYTFPTSASIPPLGYVAFSNEQMGYTLVNTNGAVQLAKNGVAIDEAITYVSPKDDYAWALINGVWQYNKQATPGRANSAVDVVDTDSSGSSEASSSKSCATNQFRNPETGRCKLINAASSTPTACKENQERNPETNRCRNIATTSAPAPCKEGQERNLETNRCRAIVKMSSAGSGVSAESKANAAMTWYYWAAIAAILLLVLSYAVWEWRQELLGTWKRLRASFAKRTD